MPAKGKGRTFAGRRPPPGGQGLARGEGGLPREGQGLARRGATPRHEGQGPPPRWTAPSRDEEALPHHEQGPSRRDEGPHPRGMTRPAGESPVGVLRELSRRPGHPGRLSRNRTSAVHIRLFGATGYDPRRRPVHDLGLIPARARAASGRRCIGRQPSTSPRWKRAPARRSTRCGVLGSQRECGSASRATCVRRRRCATRFSA